MNNKLIKGYEIPLSILFKDGENFMANVGEVAVGDKVTTNAEYDWNGTHLASFVRTTTYDVIQVGAESKDKDRYIVIGLCGVAANGIYSVGYKIPSILNIFQTIFKTKR